MDWFQTDPKQWAATQFGEANLGDKRRTNRLLHLSEQVVGNPSGSFPDIPECWADLKAAYRLFDAEEVTFQAVATPHWHRTRACPPGRYLVIGDTTEFDWGPGVEGLAPTGREVTVAEYLETLPVAGTFQLKLGARPKLPARIAHLAVSFGPLRLLPPRLKSPYLKRLCPSPISMWVVRVREVDPRPGVEPIEWVLYTSLPVETFEQAMVVVGYYEKRWLIEEWHKALKTGCQVEARQLEHHERLEAMVGLMSVIAVRLLQLKAVARSEPDRPAEELVPRGYIRLLERARKMVPGTIQAVGQFFRGLAKLGGFLGRKGDGQPGWITIWRGWDKLSLMLRGAELTHEPAISP